MTMTILVRLLESVDAALHVVKHTCDGDRQAEKKIKNFFIFLLTACTNVRYCTCTFVKYNCKRRIL